MLKRKGARAITLFKMSTTYMTVYDLLRITYTYEARALEQGRTESPSHPQSFRPRADSSMSICEVCTISHTPLFCYSLASDWNNKPASTNIPQDPETCQHLPLAGNTLPTGNHFAALETDFTAQYARRGSSGAADKLKLKREDCAM